MLIWFICILRPLKEGGSGGGFSPLYLNQVVCPGKTWGKIWTARTVFFFSLLLLSLFHCFSSLYFLFLKTCLKIRDCFASLFSPSHQGLRSLSPSHRLSFFLFLSCQVKNKTQHIPWSCSSIICSDVLHAFHEYFSLVSLVSKGNKTMHRTRFFLFSLSLSSPITLCIRLSQKSDGHRLSCCCERWFLWLQNFFIFTSLLLFPFKRFPSKLNKKLITSLSWTSFLWWIPIPYYYYNVTCCCLLRY